MNDEKKYIFKFNEYASYTDDGGIPWSTTISSDLIYPAKLILHDHKFIESIEIPNDNYLNVKLKGFEWIKINIPDEKFLIKEVMRG